VAEIVCSLVLIWSAPTFLNSNKPWLGFCLWATVPAMLGSSTFYATLRLRDAFKTKQLLQKFPSLQMSVGDCLQFPSSRVQQRLSLLEAADSDDDFAVYHLSLTDILNDQD
jgi:hypothetical protein